MGSTCPAPCPCSPWASRDKGSTCPPQDPRVSLREAVQVPPVPKIEIPPPYKVPSPGDAVVRHPIYGREMLSGKRAYEAIEEKKDGDMAEDGEAKKTKKKKKKDKKSNDN